MTYAEYEKDFLDAMDMLCKYSSGQVGSMHAAEKLGELEDLNPAWADKVLKENGFDVE